MIGRIRGTLLEKNPPEILVDVHGVGYEINVPMSTFYNLPDVGQEVTLLTHFIVREDVSARPRNAPLSDSSSKFPVSAPAQLWRFSPA